MHFGPLEGSMNGEDVMSKLHGPPSDTWWSEPDPLDPLSLTDKVGTILEGSGYK